MKYYPEVKDQVIIDMNADLVADLEKDQKEFWDKLSKERKNFFVHMTQADKSKLMSGELSEEDEELYWNHCSRKAFHYANEGHGLFARSSDMGKLGWYCVIAAVVFGIGSMTVRSLWRAKQLHELVGSPAVVAAASAPFKLNSKQNELIKPDQLMTGEQFVTYISTPGFKCEPLTDIENSFYRADGMPLCAKDPQGGEWVAGYVKQATQYGVHEEPILVQKKAGAWRSLEVTSSVSPALPSIPTVSVKEAEQDLSIAFNKNNKGDN